MKFTEPGWLKWALDIISERHLANKHLAPEELESGECFTATVDTELVLKYVSMRRLKGLPICKDLVIDIVRGHVTAAQVEEAAAKGTTLEDFIDDLTSLYGGAVFEFAFGSRRPWLQVPLSAIPTGSKK